MKKYCKSGMYVKTVSAALFVFMFLFAQSALAAKPFDLCYTSDFSGVTASLGILQTKVVEMVVKEFNAAGGLKGRPINLIIQDNGSDPSRALGNVKMFKDQYKCKVMLVDITSSATLAMKSWGDANKIPMVAASPQSEKLTVVNQPAWFFRTCGSASVQVKAALANLKKKGYTKVAFEGSTLAWGTDTLAQIKEFAPQYGITIVHEMLCEPKTKDLSIQVKKMMDSNPQAILFAEYEAETASLARAMNALGWKPFMMSTSAANLMATINLGDANLYEGWEVVTIADPGKPLVQKIWKDASKYMGKPCDEDEKAIRARDQIAVTLEALKVAKNLDDSTSIRDAFYNINPRWERASGKIGSKGGYSTAINQLLAVDDMVTLVVKGGKYFTAK